MSKITLKQAARDAIACQDACNLSGVAHSFLAAVQAVNDEAQRLGEGTEWRNHHPVIELYVHKLRALAGISPSPTHLEFHNAYWKCQDIVAAEGGE